MKIKEKKKLKKGYKKKLNLNKIKKKPAIKKIKEF